VNNNDITLIDQYGGTENIHHPYDWISNITLSDLQLFGLYSKDEKYGLFSMDLTSHLFKQVPVTYTPVNLIYVQQQLIVVDSNMKQYFYERNLSLRETRDRPPNVTIDSPLQFMTLGLTKGENEVYYSKGKDVYSGEKILTVEGDILSIVCHDHFMFVLYTSLYNHYSVLQYDILNQRRVKVVDGGYISGPPVYSCIFGNDLYISASTNNRMSLALFDLPGKTPDEQKRPRVTYPRFELNQINHRFLTEEVNLDVEKLKELKDYDIVDTTPAQNSLIRYHIWVFILLFIVSVLLLAFFFKENSVLPVILLSILFIAFSFVIKNRYSI